jgi:hypothetical protein
MRIFLLLLCGMTFFAQLTAQTMPLQIKSANNLQKGIIYNQEKLMNFRLHNQGFAVGYTVGKIKTYQKTDFYHIELGWLRHIREFRQNALFGTSTFAGQSYVLGKQNNFLPLRLGWGRKRYYSEKAVRKGVTVGMNYEMGVIAGLLKPYYLELRFQDLLRKDEKYTPENRNRFLDNSQIYGASSFSTGLSEIKIIPGVHGRIALHLDWGAHDEYARAMDIGIAVDAFPKRIPLMIVEDNPPYFINVFANLQLGKRN